MHRQKMSGVMELWSYGVKKVFQVSFEQIRIVCVSQRVIANTFSVLISHGSFMNRKTISLCKGTLVLLKLFRRLRDDPESRGSFRDTVNFVLTRRIFKERSHHQFALV